MTDPNASDKTEMGDFKELLRKAIVPNLERISVVILVIAIALKYLKMGKPELMLGVGLTSLAVTSYLYAFLHKTEGLLQTIAIKLGFIACSVLLVGIMFTFLHLPGNMIMLQVGLVALAASTAILGYLLITQPVPLFKKAGIRYALILAAGLLIYFQSI